MNFKIVIIALFSMLIFSSCCQETKEIVIFPAHSHNDYEQHQPLFNALNRGFKSIEADIYSIGDSIFVAHDFDKIKPGRTLRNMYLDPLKAIMDEKNGSVYGNGEEIILLIDIKDDAVRTYELLHSILSEYKDYLTIFRNGAKEKGGVMVVISGNRPIELMKTQAIRYAGWDGRLKDLNSGIESTLMPMVSDNWTKYFSWDGTGDITMEEKNLLKSYADSAKAHEYVLRFWATPNDTEEKRIAVWKELMDAGVGLVGADNLEELETFFMERME